MDLPPALAWLVGRWAGEGEGEYPDCDDFRYRTELEFAHARLDELVLAYSEHTWLLPDGAPSHEEAGYIRATEHGRVELVVAHPIGVVEVHDGTATDRRIDLESLTVAHTPTGSAVTSWSTADSRVRETMIWPGLASEHKRAARFETGPMAP